MSKFIVLSMLFFLSLLFVQCNYADNDCSLKRFNFGDKEYQVKGCIIDNLEQGEWFFFNAEDKLAERGNYENGLRIGKWHYPENKSDSVIAWKRYQKESLKLVFNIPVRLEIVEDSSEYIKFSNNDTSKLFNVVLSVHSIEQSKKTIEQYYKQGEEEIIANGWSFASQKSKITTPNRDLYFNEYSINQGSSQKFKVMNAYGLLSNKTIFEISCRFSEEIEASARLIFFSILTNSFYNKQRFINPLDKIKSVAAN